MKKYKDREWLYQKYTIEKLSAYKIAKECSCSVRPIFDWLKKYTIPIRSSSEAALIRCDDGKLYKNRQWLYQKYTVEKLTTVVLAKELGCTPTAVSWWLKKFAIPTRSSNESRILTLEKKNPKSMLLRNKKWLYQNYIEEQKSTCQIANELTCPASTIFNWLEKHNIPRRSSSEAAFLVYKSDPDPIVRKRRKKEYQERYRKKHMIESREKGKIRRQKRRAEVLVHYGGNPPKCVCCGELEDSFLSIDHINNDGAKHRKEINVHSGDAFYLWLKKNNFPSGFQVLCYNCNMAKGIYGKCPHEKAR